MEFDGNAVGLARSVETLISSDVNGRGSRHLVVPGDLLGAAQALLAAESVAIVTGFFIPAAGAAETDGPPGAIILARALARLGKPVVLVTDALCRPVLGHPVLAPWRRDVPVVTAEPRTQDGWRGHPGVTHLISVERPGRAADGHYYSAGGLQLDQYVEPLDALFLEAPPGLETIGIGDGGNEIGMGKVLSAVRRHVALGERIGCVVPTARLIAAGTSNWGAYGLVAVLSHLTGLDLLHAPAEEAELVAAVAAAGAVDGLSGRSEATVDGQRLAVLTDMVQALHEELAAAARRVG
ncbi:MAG: hypothetical protein BAA04_04060 [Firmicutes bacterium ZCTH02-B6]|nr:MAG: hypothetical protein BAA04_04060 [Firmicutes bacterium ZCTH02-B6]